MIFLEVKCFTTSHPTMLWSCHSILWWQMSFITQSSSWCGNNGCWRKVSNHHNKKKTETEHWVGFSFHSLSHLNTNYPILIVLKADRFKSANGLIVWTLICQIMTINRREILEITWSFQANLNANLCLAYNLYRYKCILDVVCGNPI